jgi:predicted glycosyltransferase
LPGGLLLLPQGRDSLYISDALAGMASILLHEAWLLGLPVLSLQPGLRLAALRTLQGREGLTFIDSPEPPGEAVRKWAAAVKKATRLTPRSEVQLHRQSVLKVFELIRLCLEKSVMPCWG